MKVNQFQLNLIRYISMLLRYQVNILSRFGSRSQLVAHCGQHALNSYMAEPLACLNLRDKPDQRRQYVSGNLVAL